MDGEESTEGKSQGCEAIIAGEKEEATLVQELKMTRLKLERRVEDIRRAEELLEKNPDMKELLTLILRIKRY